MRRSSKLEYFSAGSVLARWWQPSHLAPWLVSATALTVLACVDVITGYGRVDFVLLGLAAYELMIGLTEEAGAHA